MIELLNGSLAAIHAERLVVDVNGVGYGVRTPAPELTMARIGDEVKLHIWTYVKEDALVLYGFSSLQRREVFAVLLSISGVGPKAALSLLSECSVRQLAAAVRREDAKVIQRTKGIGERTAKKIVIELGSKLEKLQIALSDGKENSENAGTGQGVGEVDDVGAHEEHLAELDPTVEADVRSALTNLGYKEKEAQLALKNLVAAGPSIGGDLTKMSLGELVRLALMHMGRRPTGASGEAPLNLQRRMCCKRSDVLKAMAGTIGWNNWLEQLAGTFGRH